MHEQIEERREALKAEFEAGQKMLGELEARQAQLRETMLRISGAIQVLDELLGAGASASAQPADTPA
jgi:predicted nuclease with TOPRIM domain